MNESNEKMKVKWKNSTCHLLTKNCWESMEKQFISSGIFSKGFRHWFCFKRSIKICERGTSNLKDSQTGSSSCQWSTTSIGQQKETKEFVFRNQKKVEEYGKILSQGHCTFFGLGDEKKWYGILPCTLEGK